MTIHHDDFGSHGDRCRRRGTRGRRGGTYRGARRERKEKVLHTRISEQLAEDIRQFAEDLRVPASNLVRNVLEEVFTVVDNMSDDVTDLMDDVLEEAEGVRDRVRRQASSRRRRGRTRRRRGRGGVDDADVEAELREDEAAEAADAGSQGSADEGGAQEDTKPTEPERPTAAELFPDVIGWQPLVLNRDLQCGRCEAALHAGESAFLGMTTSGVSEKALCGRCASQSTGRR